MLRAGDLVKTTKGNLALVSNIDETIIDEWGESQVNFVTLIYCSTGIENRYCDVRHLTLVNRGE